MASNLLKSTQPKHLDLSILFFLVKLVWVRASVYWLFCKALKNSMLSFYTNQLIIYLSMKKCYLFKKKLYKNLILCVIIFLRSSTTLAFAVWIILTCPFSYDHNIILFFTYVNVFIYLSFFFNLSHVNGAEWNKPMVITDPAVPNCWLFCLCSKLYPSNMQHMLDKDLTPFILDLFLSMPKLSKWKKSSASRVSFWQLPFQISSGRFTDDFDSISCYTVCKH